MKPSLLILPLVAALAVGTASAQDGDGQGPPNGDRAVIMAKRLIEMHDENSDGALNEAELAEALKTMRKHHMRRHGPGEGAGEGRDNPRGPANNPEANAE